MDNNNNEDQIQSQFLPKTVRDGEKNTENILTRQPDQVQATGMNLSFLYLLPVNAKELALFGNLSQFPLGGKLSFKMMAFNAVQDRTETLVKGANIVKDL